jgi:aspartate aminotransferase-like enzyme
MMEAAIRNCVKKRVLSCICGAFSDRWHGIAIDNGKEADRLEVEWGQAIRAEMIEDRLKSGRYDSVTLVHNETSTGVMNPLNEISEVMYKFKDICFIIDAVSSMSGTKIEVDRLGIDIALAGLQKAFALPPGFAVASVSDKALQRAREVSHRGHYFDFLEYQRNDDRGQTSTTPSLPHIYALDRQLDRMFREGMENRFARHETMARLCRGWAEEHFALFPEKGYESVTLTAVRNTRGISIAELNRKLIERHGAVISDGYGKLKDRTFRIAHMGEITVADLEELLGWIEELLP